MIGYPYSIWVLGSELIPVSPQVTSRNPAVGCSAVTFRLMTEAHVCEQRAQGCYVKVEQSGVEPISFDRESITQTITLPLHTTAAYTAGFMNKARFPLAELTARVNGQSWRVTGFHSISVLTGARFPLAELTASQLG